jgi:HPP family
MERNRLFDVLHIGLLVLAPGLAAWLSGRPLIFPSLGPSAFVLVLDKREDRARRVLGGHLIGAASGFVAYHALAHGLALADVSPALSLNGLRVVASGIVSVFLTSWVMLTTRTNHAPACATTLIVSLGLLSGLIDVMLIMMAVLGMFLTHRLILLARK